MTKGNNTRRPLLPDRTIAPEAEFLSARRPVHVWTHIFPPVGRELPRPGDAMVCGDAFEVEDRPSIEPHDHKHYEIGLVTAGKALHRTESYETYVGKGTVYVVAPGAVHAFEDIQWLHIVNCAYLTEWLVHSIGDLWSLEGLIPLFLATGIYSQSPVQSWVPQYQLDDEEFDAVLEELSDLGREWQRPEPCLPFMKWCLEKLMLILGRAFALREDNQAQLTYHPEVQHVVGRVEQFIAQGQPFHVSDVAAEVDMSADYLSRVFKEATGWSPMDYFQRRRVQHASWLLLNTEHSVTDVAQVLGFCDSPHFSHLFKRYQGISPRTYRRRYAGGEPSRAPKARKETARARRRRC